VSCGKVYIVGGDKPGTYYTFRKNQGTESGMGSIAPSGAGLDQGTWF